MDFPWEEEGKGNRMALDIRSLLIAAALATACCAVARILLFYLHRSIPGLGQWAAASLLGVMSLLLIAVREQLPDWIALSFGQLLILAGFLLTWEGVRLFLGRPRLDRDLIIGLVLASLTALGVAQISGALMIRSAVNAALIGIISAQVARELLRDCPGHLVARRFTGWVYGVNALFFCFRLIAAWQNVEKFGPASVMGMSSMSVLWWLGMVIAITLGMVLMTGERLQEDLNHQASRDPLTGALNRRAFTALAEKELARARRAGTPLSLLMIDMDHFKWINDCLGHGGGDDALVRFAAQAGKILRAEDLLCRFGGEEFLALLPGSAIAEAQGVAERLRQAYAGEVHGLDPDGRLPFAVTLSAGIAALEPGEEVDGLIRRADKALYRAKEAGRDRCVLAG